MKVSSCSSAWDASFFIRDLRLTSELGLNTIKRQGRPAVGRVFFIYAGWLDPKLGLSTRISETPHHNSTVAPPPLAYDRERPPTLTRTTCESLHRVRDPLVAQEHRPPSWSRDRAATPRRPGALPPRQILVRSLNLFSCEVLLYLQI